MNFKKILVPVTLADGSRAAVAVAANLAKESGASLALLHAVQLSIAGEERGIPRTRLVNDLCREAEGQLRQLLEGVTLQTPTEIIVREGRPAQTIVESARRLAVDAIGALALLLFVPAQGRLCQQFRGKSNDKKPQ